MGGDAVTYTVVPTGFAVVTDRSPIPDEGKVLLTFNGEFVDTVCVGGIFYPIKNGTAEIPTVSLTHTTPVTAYTLSERRRYPCDAIGVVEADGERYLVPVSEGADLETVATALAIAALEARVAALEADLATLRERISPTPFTFGETV